MSASKTDGSGADIKIVRKAIEQSVGSPISRIGIELMSSGRTTVPHANQEIAQAIRGVRTEERLIAAWCAGRLPLTEDERKDIQKQLGTQVIATRIETNWIFSSSPTYRGAICGTMFALTVLTILVAAAPGSPTFKFEMLNRLPSYIISGLIIATGMVLGGLAGRGLSRRESNYSRAMRLEVLAALGRLGDSACIKTLAFHVDSKEKRLSATASNALKQLMHRSLLAQEAFPNHVVSALMDCIEHCEQGLALQILDIVEVHNDPAFAPELHELSKTSHSHEVRKRALEVLTIIKQASRKQELHGALLRPADFTGEDSLLRPAGSTYTPSDKLLRPLQQESAP